MVLFSATASPLVDHINHIIFSCANKKMLRPHTHTIIAVMANIHSVYSYGWILKLKCNSMSRYWLAMEVKCSISH